MGRGFGLRREDTGTFKRDLDAEGRMRQFGRIAQSRHLDRAVADIDRIAVDLHLARKAAVNRIETQEMRIGFDRPEIVDGDDVNVPASGLDNGAQHIAADASEAVDCNIHRHKRLLLIASKSSGSVWRSLL